MSRRQLHAGEIFGIVLLVSIAIDLIVGFGIKSNILRISPLHAGGWVSWSLIAAGVIAFVVGCVGSSMTHKAFNEAVSPNGEVKYILKSGLFRLVRHPFYLSLSLITLSFFLIFRSYILMAGLVVTAVILAGAARKEEKLLVETFGEEYLTYQRKTGMFFPKAWVR